MSADRIKGYLMAAVSGQKSSLLTSLTLFFLSFLEKIYSLLLKTRKVFYKSGLIKKYRLACQVISVGNIIAGGTGKTPLVKKLTEELKEEGKRVVIISRGYGADNTDPVVVSDGKEILSGVEKAGDEAIMLARLIQDVPVVIGKERSAAAKQAIADFNPEIIILDDGFQHWQLCRDLDIVIIDATNPFGYWHLLPRGFLREPLTSLKRAGLLIISRAGQVSEERVEEINHQLREYNQKAAILTARHQPSYIRQILVEGSKLLEPGIIYGKKILAFSGIGNPGSFENSIADIGGIVYEHLVFPDHYQYQEGDFSLLKKKIENNNIDWLLTTEKDAVKLDKIALKQMGESGCNIGVLGIELEVSGNLVSYCI